VRQRLQGVLLLHLGAQEAGRCGAAPGAAGQEDWGTDVRGRISWLGRPQAWRGAWRSLIPRTWKMSRSVLRMALMKRRTLWSFLRCPVGQCRRRLGVPAAPNDHSAHIPLDSDGSQSTVYPRELPKRVVMVSTCPSPSLLESVYTLRPNIAGEGGTRPRGGDGVAEAPGSSPRLPMPRELKTEPHLKELPNDR